MTFEFDRSKSLANTQKHGISFVEAQSVWADNDAISIKSRDTPELRFLAIGRIGQTFWSVVWT